jgi:hypothetical protein
VYADDDLFLACPFLQWKVHILVVARFFLRFLRVPLLIQRGSIIRWLPTVRRWMQLKLPMDNVRNMKANTAPRYERIKSTHIFDVKSATSTTQA